MTPRMLVESLVAGASFFGRMAVGEARAAAGRWSGLAGEMVRLRAENARLQRACDEGLPREVILCPKCARPHIEGPRHDDPSVDGRTRPHHTHRCYLCAHVWDAKRWSFGIAPAVAARREADALRGALGVHNLTLLGTNSDTPRPLHEVLRRLADAGDHLLDVHNCDEEGNEEIRYAVRSAREIAAVLRAEKGQ